MPFENYKPFQINSAQILKKNSVNKTVQYIRSSLHCLHSQTNLAFKSLDIYLNPCYTTQNRITKPKTPLHHPCYTTQNRITKPKTPLHRRGVIIRSRYRKSNKTAINFVKMHIYVRKRLCQKEFKQMLCYLKQMCIPCVSRSENCRSTGVESLHCYSHNCDCCFSLIMVLPKQTKMTVQILKICSVKNCSVHK